MKNTVKTAALLGLLAGLLSCGLFANFGKADVRIDIAPVASAGIGDPYARVWLTADGELYTLDGDNAYLAAQLSDTEKTTIVIEGIPVGPRYQVLLSTGILQDGWFDTWEWGESAEFNLEAGANTAVSVPVQSSNFDYTFDLTGKNLVDVEVVGSTIYTAEAATLWSLDSLFSTSNPTAIEPGYTANSLTDGINFSSGLANLWINTNKGILPLGAAAPFDTAFSTNLGEVPVLDSVTRSALSGHVVYFRREGGLGGVYADADVPDPSSWTWVNLASDEVYDLLCPSPGEGYFATSGEALRLQSAILQDASPTIAEHKLPLAPPAKVLSWGLIDQYGDGDVLFMGTVDGAWRVRMNQGVWLTDPPEDSLQRVAGTEGQTILMTEIFSTAGYEFAAFLSPDALYVYETVSATPTLKSYPFYSGLPEGITGMDFSVEFSSEVYLMISARGGLFYVFVKAFPLA